MQGLENRKSNSSPLVLPYPLHGNFDTRLSFLLENPERPQGVTCVQDLPFLVNTVFLLASSGWQWYCPTLLATPEVPSVTPNSAEGLHLLKKLMPSLNPLMTEPKDSLVCAKRPGGCVEGLKGKKITILLSPLLTVKFNIRYGSVFVMVHNLVLTIKPLDHPVPHLSPLQTLSLPVWLLGSLHLVSPESTEDSDSSCQAVN
nr:uncharacterized protein LOC129463774 [Symphalangus syndactylus]